MIILDTNVVSEMMLPAPAKTVTDWLAAHQSEDLFTTTITQAEILFGIAKLPGGGRRTALFEIADAIFSIDFKARVLPFDTAAAQAFATLAAERRARGRPVGTFDLQVAAIAYSFDATVATRNISDFEGFGPDVVNPWQS